MIWGCAGLSICMMMLAALLSPGDSNPTAASAAVAFFFLYMLIFGGEDIQSIGTVRFAKRYKGTINVVPWVYGPEILPLEARTRGTAIASKPSLSALGHAR